MYHGHEAVCISVLTTDKDADSHMSGRKRRSALRYINGGVLSDILTARCRMYMFASQLTTDMDVVTLGRKRRTAVILTNLLY